MVTIHPIFVSDLYNKTVFTFYDVGFRCYNVVLVQVKATIDRLKPLRQELKMLMKEVEEGKVDKRQAAERIIEIRLKMDEVIEELRNSAK